MSFLRPLSVAFVLLCPITLAAAPPELQPATCTYLTGAPAGYPAAPTEERISGTALDLPCLSLTTVSTNVNASNSAEITHENTGSGGGVRDSCRARAWVGHQFSVARAASGHVDMTASIRLATHFNGSDWGNRARVHFQVLEGDGVTATVIAEGLLIDLHLHTIQERVFDKRVSASFIPGRLYTVQLLLETDAIDAFSIDIGRPGTDHGARYDSIEVCLYEPEEDTATLDAIAALQDADIEEKLHRKECLPTLWMPAAQGGRLELARDLVADLITRASATGDSSVNDRVAADRLARADAEIASGAYQRACKSLSDSLRMLTTP